MLNLEFCMLHNFWDPLLIGRYLYGSELHASAAGPLSRQERHLSWTNVPFEKSDIYKNKPCFYVAHLFSCFPLRTDLGTQLSIMFTP